MVRAADLLKVSLGAELGAVAEMISIAFDSKAWVRVTI